MSDWRSNIRGGQRGTDRSWRSRGRSRGRGAATAPTVGSREATATTTNSRPSEKAPTSTPSDAFAARRRMNLMASVSRSSGLEKDGDDLKNYQIQEEYRKFIQEKVDDVLANRLRRRLETEIEKKQRIDNQENVLILFRKLREGVASSGRNDVFAMEAYETSLHLSILFESPKQTMSIIPHLFHLSLDSKPSPSSTRSTVTPSIHTVLSSLLHHLVTSYPSQSQYHQHLGSINHTLLLRKSDVYLWLASVTKSLRMRNYAKFANLTRKATVTHAIDASITLRDPNAKGGEPKGSDKADDSLALVAMFCLLDALRRKAADTAWTVIRSGYRELSVDQVETKAWLVRSLCLESVQTDNQTVEVDDWLDTRVPLGHVRRKEGIAGRWIICKVR